MPPKIPFWTDATKIREEPLNEAKSAGVSCPMMEFGPDGAFACDLRDDPTASSFLQANGLQAGKFVCCIPRLRNTPY